MQTDANSFANRILDILASACNILFGGGEPSRTARRIQVPDRRPPIADIDVRIAITASGFHYVHAVIDNEYVFTSTSQKGGLIPIDRTLTPLDLMGNVDRRVDTAVTALLDAHADWTRAGKPAQLFDKVTLEKIERNVDPVSGIQRKPRKPRVQHSVEETGTPDEGIPLAEMRDFFLQQPTILGIKRSG